MKKIIIAESIMCALGRHGAIFGRCHIMTYTARTSEEILNIHAVCKADLIITDYSLPPTDGAELCSAIRSDPRLKNVSIIAACDRAHTSPSQCLKAGANAVVTKPVDPIKLFSKISDLLVIPQRKDLKVLLRVSAESGSDSSFFLGVSHNISTSGMLMETNRELKQGDRLTCVVPIGRREIMADSAVTRANKAAAGRFRYGVKFSNLDPGSLLTIEQFVTSRVRH